MVDEALTSMGSGGSVRQAGVVSSINGSLTSLDTDVLDRILPHHQRDDDFSLSGDQCPRKRIAVPRRELFVDGNLLDSAERGLAIVLPVRRRSVASEQTTPAAGGGKDTRSPMAAFGQAVRISHPSLW